MKRLLGILAISFLTGVSNIVYVLATLPDVQSLKRTNPQTTALVEQRARENKTRVQPLRSWVPYGQISPNLRNAVIVAEDGAFFQHSGFDLHEIKDSAKRNWREKRFVRGASTITQQLA